jgi:hypothetical protein
VHKIDAVVNTIQLEALAQHSKVQSYLCAMQQPEEPGLQPEALEGQDGEIDLS